jgi:hypothetical protein
MIKESKVEVSKDPVVSVRSMIYNVDVADVHLTCQIKEGRLEIHGKNGKEFIFAPSKPETVEKVALALLECSRLGMKATKKKRKC